MSHLAGARAVTFDCWNTLIVDEAPQVANQLRLEAFVRLAGEHGRPLETSRARGALTAAWQRHNTLWLDGTFSGADEMARWALESLDLADVVPPEALAGEFSELALQAPIRALEGARDTLARLAEHGVRRALVCDTGFSPGRVVRRMLDREGLLEYLEVQVFSNEVGVPKPDPRMFHAALEPLDVAPADAVHVGDLRKTDILGGRGVGMRTVRIRHAFDDDGDHPEADAVAADHAELRRILDVA